MASRSSDAPVSFNFTSTTIANSKNDSKNREMPSRSCCEEGLDQGHLLSSVTGSGDPCQWPSSEPTRATKSLPIGLSTRSISALQPPNTSRSVETSEMNWLLSELAKLHKERRAGQEQQNTILEQLRKMGASDAILKPILAVMDCGIGSENETAVDTDMAEGMEVPANVYTAPTFYSGQLPKHVFIQ